MANFFTSMFLKSLLLLIFLLETIPAEKDSIFSFQSFGEKSSVSSKLDLFGDSKIVNGTSSVQIVGFANSSAGRVFCKTPIKLANGNPKRFVSFSTRFVFSMSHGKGNGLAFVMVPFGFPLDSFDGGSFGMLKRSNFRTLAVEFDTKMDKEFGDVNANHVGIYVNANHVGIDVNSLISVKTSNVSGTNLVLNSGEKLEAWVDYVASSKRIEVRLAKLGERKPIYPLLSCPIDLSRMWKEEEVLIGLSSSNENSSQQCDLYSWDFSIRKVPRWIHSEPLDPAAVSKNTKTPDVPKERDCHLKVLGALVFGVSCGAFGSFFLLFVWALFVSKQPVVPAEFLSKHVEFEPEMLKIVVGKSIEDGKN